jgi:hypothetical protein
MRRICSRLPKPLKAITCSSSRSSFVPSSCARISARPKPLGSDDVIHRTEKNGCRCVIHSVAEGNIVVGVPAKPLPGRRSK